MQTIMGRLFFQGKRLAYRYGHGTSAVTYPYMLEPMQLAVMVLEFERLRNVPGCVLEIGAFRGMTTRFMCEHFVRQGVTDTAYIALDTFCGFPPTAQAFEVEHRGKSAADFASSFVVNDRVAWERHFAPFPFVRAIQADCGEFDYRELAPIKLALLDVDLYHPTSRALPRLYDALAPGGVVLVDDVAPSQRFDGAHQAYLEFCAAVGAAPETVGTKGGILRKPW